MADSRRHPRKPVNEPAAIKTEAGTYDGKLQDISESGAGVAFALPGGEAKVQFDIGSNIEVDSQTLDHQEGRVIRHYDGGFAVNFESDGYGEDGGS